MSKKALAQQVDRGYSGVFNYVDTSWLIFSF